MNARLVVARSFETVVRERAVTIAHETERATGFRRIAPPAPLLPPTRERTWREQQARQQRYEAMVCERLGQLWADAVPQMRERGRRASET